jgi:membrane peptidoglycan carboxypeptidase
VVGGRNFEKGAYNAALQGVGRQPGSSFKTFVLAAALAAGISPDSVWESSGFDQLVCGSPWNVNNYEGGGSGPVSVRDATRRSVNGVYGRLMEKLCPQKVAEMAEKLGIPKIAPDNLVPAMALGAAEVRPIDMASAYATLADLGEYHKPTFFEKIDHRSGRAVIGEPSKPERRVSAALAWQVNDILKGVIRGGTGTAANIGRPAAGKTGTNQAYRDAWFVGYTPQLAVAVWMGYPDAQREMYNVMGRRVSGGSFPAQVWHDFMAAAMANQEPLDWPKPPEELTYTILPPPPEKKDDDKDKDEKPGKPDKPRRPGRPGGNDEELPCRTSTTRPAPRSGLRPWRRCCRCWSARPPTRPASTARAGRPGPRSRRPASRWPPWSAPPRPTSCSPPAAPRPTTWPSRARCSPGRRGSGTSSARPSSTTPCSTPPPGPRPTPAPGSAWPRWTGSAGWSRAGWPGCSSRGGPPWSR